METWIVVGVIVFIGVVLYWRMPKSNNSSDDSARELKMLAETKGRIEYELKSSNEKIVRLENELKRESEIKNDLSGQNKRMYIENKDLAKDNSLYKDKIEELHKIVVKYESTEEKRQQEFEKKVEDVNETRRTLEDEKARIRKEDNDKKIQSEEERDRIWNEHENSVIKYMKTICQKPELSFNYYENSSLPETFDGSLKPDFLIDFLGHYIIFDAKMSRSNDLNVYISNQVKSTVKKIKESKNCEEVYTKIFFVVPYIDFINLKKSSYYEDGYTFYVITEQSFEPIISAYKRICDYDLADSFDPKERENIVNLIATYDHHISKQNAVNILSSAEGIKVSLRKNVLNKELLSEIETKKSKIRIENFKPTDLKRLIQNPTEQIKEIISFVKPKDAEISSDDLESANQTLL